jgi:hypothetical protein
LAAERVCGGGGLWWVTFGEGICRERVLPAERVAWGGRALRRVGSRAVCGALLEFLRDLLAVTVRRDGLGAQIAGIPRPEGLGDAHHTRVEVRGNADHEIQHEC